VHHSIYMYNLLLQNMIFKNMFLSNIVYIQEIVSKWFYDTSTGAATRAAHCGSLLERV
jgi:hypothetical protein